MEAVPLPDGLKTVPRPMLEDYVLERIRQFSQVYTSQLLGSEANNKAVEVAFNNAVSILGATAPQANESFFLRFTHKCRFLGCKDKECSLCINNPNKTCAPDDNFDECYANDQVLKSKCEADVHLELVSASTGRRHDMSGFEVQVCVIDGESVGSGAQPQLGNVKELLKSDEGNVLLGSYVSTTTADSAGRLQLRMQDGQCRLPDLHIKDKNDTFHLNSCTYSSFRLMGVAIQRDMFGNAVVLESVVPTVSQKFNVKTQRALNDYRKSEYPHYRDELTKLRYIGSITATRLRDVQAFVADVPFTAIETVEQMKHLLLYADQNRAVESKLLELLNMKGKHKHKWEYLHELLAERIVYDDMVHRAWYTDDSMSQGLLYACKQGQVSLEKPFGLAHRAVSAGQARLQVLPPSDVHSQDVMKTWRAAAEEAWLQPGHPGWAIVSEPLELVNAGSGGSAMARMGAPRGSGPVDMEVVDALTSRPSSSHSYHAMLESQASMQSGQPMQYARANSGSTKSGELPAGFQFTSPGRSPRHPSAAASPLSAATTRPIKADPFGSINGAADAPDVFGDASAAVAAGGAHDPRLDVYGLRASSSPSLIAQNPFARAGSGSDGGPDFVAGSFGSEPFSPNMQHPRTSPASRLRRMSASAAKPYRLHTEHSAPTNGAFEDGLLTDLVTSKRARSSMPTAEHAASASGVVPPPMSAPHAMLSDFMDNPFVAGAAAARSSSSASMTQLYHQESHGRHLPRARGAAAAAAVAACASVEGAHPMSPRAALLQQHAAMQQATAHAASVDMDAFLAHSLPPAMAAAHSPGSPVEMVSGAAPASPSAVLSDSMRRSLDLGNSGGQTADGEVSTAAGPGRTSIPGTGVPDSFNKQLNRILKHSESDSFKHLLDNFASPGLADVEQSKEFAAFLDEFAGQAGGK